MNNLSTNNLPAAIAGGVNSNFPLEASPTQNIFYTEVYSASLVKIFPDLSNFTPTDSKFKVVVTGYLPVAKKTVSYSSFLSYYVSLTS